MKLIILLLMAFCTCLVLSKRNYDKQWKEYKKKFEKSYGPKEDAERKQIFIEYVKKMEKHNKEAKNGLHPYYMGYNKFSDKRDEEIEQMFASPCIDRNYKPACQGPILCGSESSPKKVPRSIDWNKRGHVTSVENQGKCAGCYAFAAAGTLESLVKKKTGVLQKLSAQEIIDCSHKTGNNGCKGGYMTPAFKYIEQHGGISKAAEYPFTGQVGNCMNLVPSVPLKITSCYSTSNGTEEELKIAVATIGPVSVAIALHESFSRYQRGIYMDPNCAKNDYAHGALVVGYGTTKKGTDYWIIKNSWGTNWGLQGFMRMKRNAGICRIGTKLTYAAGYF